MAINCKGKTDIGQRRETNQDYFRIEELSENLLLMVVCDGMGGAVGGSEASSIATNGFVDYVKENIDNVTHYGELMLCALKKANDDVCDKAQSTSGLEGMGTTLVAAIYDGEKYTCVWIGDSRIYALTDDGLLQISHDHSYVQTLIDSGNITQEEAKIHPNRNIITKAVGTDRTLEGDVCVMDAEKINGLLLCSDGLCGYVEEKAIESVCSNEQDTEKCVEKLVQMANDAGGPDNITVIVHRK